MSSQALIEVDGNKYMSTKTAADLWGLSPRTVSDYCKNNRRSTRTGLEMESRRLHHRPLPDHGISARGTPVSHAGFQAR